MEDKIYKLIQYVEADKIRLEKEIEEYPTAAGTEYLKGKIRAYKEEIEDLQELLMEII